MLWHNYTHWLRNAAKAICLSIPKGLSGIYCVFSLYKWLVYATFIYTGWSKSHATHSWNMFCSSKNKLHWNQETKKRYIKCWKCPPCSAMHAFTLFLMFDATQWRVSAVTGNSSPDEISSIYLAQENWEMYP
jgi:hypothetical protein